MNHGWLTLLGWLVAGDGWLVASWLVAPWLVSGCWLRRPSVAEPSEDRRTRGFPHEGRSAVGAEGVGPRGHRQRRRGSGCAIGAGARDEPPGGGAVRVDMDWFIDLELD